MEAAAAARTRLGRPGGSGAEPERPPPPLSRISARRGHHDPADPRRRPGLETPKRTGPGEGERGQGGGSGAEGAALPSPDPPSGPPGPEEARRDAPHLGSLNDPKRPISWDASLSGACGASSRRRRWWRWCLAEAAGGRGHIGCYRVSAGRGTRRRSWCGLGAAGRRAGGGTGGRRHRHPRGAHAARRARLSASCPALAAPRRPNGCAPAAAALRE